MKKLNYTFNGYEKVEKSFSQSFQDLFVLAVLNGKTNGTFLEIGASHPTTGSNTYLLETVFNWKGIGIDILDIGATFADRKNYEFIHGNAINLDYEKILEKISTNNRIDYISLDIDPNENTLACLKNLPMDKYRFSVITYETDYYRPSAPKEHNERIRTESREIFKKYGYELIFGDVCNYLVSIYGCPDVYEDWYVDPNIISEDIIKKMKRVETSLLTAHDYIYGVE